MPLRWPKSAAFGFTKISRRASGAGPPPCWRWNCTRLVCRNLDVPGVIGRIGTILGEYGVNIANFALGRDRSGVKPVHALAVVQVDPPVPPAVLEALLKIEALLEVRLVKLPNG